MKPILTLDALLVGYDLFPLNRQSWDLSLEPGLFKVFSQHKILGKKSKIGARFSAQVETD